MTIRKFDYIIIGGGSAGCVLAHRLSADPQVRVLLLEAGPARGPREMAIPAAWAKLFTSNVDWGFRTVPQRALDGRSVLFPRGRVLGGSSATNAQIWLRGHAEDFDAWARAGCDGWRFDDVQPYFAQIERNAGGTAESATARVGAEGRGRAGLLHVSQCARPNPLAAAFVEAMAAAGVARVQDFNAESLEGAGFCAFSQRRGQRMSAADAYLTPVLSRTNLHVVCAAAVQRIRIDRGRAVGVDYALGGSLQCARAEREVILSAGAVHSPQLLMLSGIGPAQHLRSVGVPVQLDAPGVGENLQDHPVVPVLFRSRRPVSMLRAESWDNVLNYLLRRRGMLASNGVEALAHVRSNAALAAPDLQLLMVNALWHDEGLTPPTEHGFSICASVLTPASRGRVQLQSASAGVAPLIDPAYLVRAEDRHRMRVGVGMARELAASAAMREFSGIELDPGREAQGDAAIDAFLRRRTQSYYHPVGTCRMGVDGNAVVDPQLRVHGVDGLRVVDASIMPTLPRANTNAATVMVAEHAAALILSPASAQHPAVRVASAMGREAA